MADVLELPVRSDVAFYEFTMELERKVYLFRFRFNFRMGRWLMDVANRDGVNIVAGVPVLSGVDLIDRFESELLPPGDLMVFDTTLNLDSPGYSDFGKTIKLFYFETGTIA